MNNPTGDAPAWPHIRATIREDGSGEVDFNGTVHQLSADATLEEARQHLVNHLTGIARWLARPVTALAESPDDVQILVVHPDGTVEEETTGDDDAGHETPSDEAEGTDEAVPEWVDAPEPVLPQGLIFPLSIVSTETDEPDEPEAEDPAAASGPIDGPEAEAPEPEPAEPEPAEPEPEPAGEPVPEPEAAEPENDEPDNDEPDNDEPDHDEPTAAGPERTEEPEAAAGREAGALRLVGAAPAAWLTTAGRTLPRRQVLGVVAVLVLLCAGVVGYLVATGDAEAEPAAEATEPPLTSTSAPSSPATSAPVSPGTTVSPRPGPTVRVVRAVSGRGWAALRVDTLREVAVEVRLIPLGPGGKPLLKRAVTERFDVAGSGRASLRVAEIDPGTYRWRLKVVAGGRETERPLKGQVSVRRPPPPQEDEGAGDTATEGAGSGDTSSGDTGSGGAGSPATTEPTGPADSGGDSGGSGSGINDGLA